MDWVLRFANPVGYLLLVAASSALPPVLAAAVYHEPRELLAFLAFGGAAALAGAGLVRVRPGRSLSAEEAMALTAFSYLVFSLVGALPFLTVVPFIDGWFEATSGITTTGLSVIPAGGLPRSLILFRSLYQWIGGAGIIVISLAFLLPPGRTALALYSAEQGGGNLAGNVRLTARRVSWVYLGLTGVGFVAYWLSGMGPFDAGVHILSTVSTGGFSPYAASIGHYSRPAIKATVALFMLLGATSFPLFWLLKPGKLSSLLKARQLWLLLGLALGFGGIIGISLGRAGEGLFQAISALSTTGFSSLPTPRLPPIARWLTILGMIIGGSGGSTAGGLKLFRLLGLLALVRWSFSRRRLPAEAEVPFRVLGVHFEREEILELVAYGGLYLAVLAAATLALTGWGYGIEASLFEAASAQGTVGLSLGITGPQAPIGVKLILIGLMWMGRLEILPVILLLRRAVVRS